jgi:hypothetical protein
MKKFILPLLPLLFTQAVSAADFKDLAVKASELKEAAAAAIPGVAPELSQILADSNKDGRWYGADSRKAKMHFETYVLYALPAGQSAAGLLNSPAQKKKVREIVDLQLQHMYGAFTTHPGFVDNPGIPSGDYKVELLSSESAGSGYAKVRYSYDDLVVFSSKLFGGGSATIDFVLPKDPVTVYSKGFPTPQSRVNRCTDQHYNTEGDFWYFWNPYQEGCPLTGSDLVGIRTTLVPVPMTSGTYPEYAKLYGDNGNGDVLQVSYLVGVDANFQNGDLGRTTFNEAFKLLQAAGFRATVNEARRKQLVLNAGSKKTHVQMLLLDPDSAEFAAEAVRGMQSDIFLYDGHSGLGGYLDPERLVADAGRPLALPLKKYQVFIFQGCSTYAYYNTAYFNLKRTSADPKGTKNLDIVTTGIGAAFEVGAKVDVALLTGLATGQRQSWQTIMNNVRKAEGADSALSHVNGDEDNPRNP